VVRWDPTHRTAICGAVFSPETSYLWSMRRSCLALVLIAVLGCGGHKDRPPYFRSNKLDAGAGGGFNVSKDNLDCGLPPVSDAGLCGNDIIPTQEDRPNLYFVIDASGSMSFPFPADPTQIKYAAAVNAITAVLQVIGHRVSYGAALFPEPNRDTSNPYLDCLPGSQKFATRAGDSVGCSIRGQTGDTLRLFNQTLNGFAPSGGTPLSATLTSLVSTLTALPGKTAVILATDGAPNCNPNASCGIDLCQSNLAQVRYTNGLVCDASINCCDPKVVPDGPSNCVDNVATNQALTALKEASIPTYVIGLPGESTSSAILDSMAVAGGTARDTSPRYYETDDAQTLADTLRSIATNLAVSCTIKLGQSPPNWGQVAVYFDKTRIPPLTDDGWQQVDTNTLQITGTYCDQLMTGNVFQVQVVAGCPTYVN
jgi:hypothetical protein